jgi:hypothetical protein
MNGEKRPEKRPQGENWDLEALTPDVPRELSCGHGGFYKSLDFSSVDDSCFSSQKEKPR